eukprot:TRINITY_DN13976_c0_g1_i1.p1 TRINITY_DN13976_c0_g1~~TRINITY_DN13976_c0_g1_i1.p1  ORF type:complete len:176 (-),score=35.29 TRINITY_DN13976_c0_g1_i1:34-561(-)
MPNMSDARDYIENQTQGKNVTRILNFIFLICGIGLIPAGIFGFLDLSFNILNFVVAAYIIGAGITTCIAAVPFGRINHKLAYRFFPFLQSYKGRGAWLILWGSLAVGLGLIGFIVGIVTVVLGAAHFILSIWFHHNLAKDPTGESLIGDMNAEEDQGTSYVAMEPNAGGSGMGVY